jgi:Cu+-exporting ATPase
MSNADDNHAHHGHADPHQKPSENTTIDPVCGMSVATDAGKPTESWQGETFHFCSEKCHGKFESDPYFYASGNSSRQVKTMHEATDYTCPMHPEIIRQAPGSCPKCGMALEPVIATRDAPNEELIEFTRRMWISAAVAVPLIFMTMGPLVGLPVRSWIGEQFSIYLEFVLATPIVLWAAQPFFVRGWNSIRTVNPNMWTLIAIGVAAAYLYSLVATFLPGYFQRLTAKAVMWAPIMRPPW